MTDPRLLRLRVELYTAAQSLTGEDAAEFWRLIDEIATTGRLQKLTESLAPPAPTP